METDILPIFDTMHIPLATYLAIKNVQLSTINLIKKRGKFVFIQVPRQFIIDFNNGTALVEPDAYANQMTGLIQKVRTINGGSI